MLAKVFCENVYSLVSYLAVENLGDQKLLAKVALESKDESIRAEAIKKLTDQDVLVKIALSDKDPFVRRSAMCKVDPNVSLSKQWDADVDRGRVIRLRQAVQEVSKLKNLDNVVVKIETNKTSSEYRYRDWDGSKSINGERLSVKYRDWETDRKSVV